MAKTAATRFDDEETASETEPQLLEASSGAQKRRIDPELSEKVHWTDESDSVQAKPKKRRVKRQSTRKKEKSSLQEGDVAREDGGDVPDAESCPLPEYIAERRKQFDERKKLCLDSALKLPPDFTGIEFEDLEGLEDLKERPQFDARTGVKPSRPYKDIELSQSGGLIPASIAQYLRDYQVDGVRFLHKKFVYQEGGILGDDMGLGKTVQVAAFLAVAFGKTGDERDDKRMRQIRFYGKKKRWYPQVLIVCPGSLIANWRNELTRWGWWHIDIFHGAGKDDILTTARSGLSEIMITTYDTYKSARDSINMVEWDAVIADECHRLKDSYSQTTRAMMEVNALCRIGLTGTAIQNKYEELWTLLDWTNPGHFGSAGEWSNAITKPLTVGQSHDATKAQLSLARQTAKKLVQNLLPRYFLRRMKTLIAHQLPRKTDRVVFCPLTDMQRQAYLNFLESREIEILRTVSDLCSYHRTAKGWCCNQYLPDNTRWQSIVFPSMIALQKLANHLTLLVPQTTEMDERHQSALKTLKTCMPNTWKPLYKDRDRISNLVNPEHCGKWKILRKLLKFWHGSGDKVLVFSHSVRLLRILQHLFTSTSYTVSYLDGSMSYEARQDVVDSFNSDPSQFVFLISTKAGGVGLNITSANKVVIVDPHWNPAYDLQAQDRAYRIGQTRDVEVFRLISVGTIEEIVYARQIYKQQQANIGYTASSERRYFRGVQQDTQRKGEIFGLSNIFTYHSDMGLLRDIVNKTNIAEAKAGVNLADVDMDRAASEEDALGPVKSEDADEDGGLSQLASILTSKDQGEALLKSKKKGKPQTNAVQAILRAAGVDYTHENSEVIGSSKVEEQLSKQAEMALQGEDGHLHGQTTLFRDSDDEGAQGLHGTYNPPEDVCLRQFCEMAREFGFGDATEFALIVEGWSQEERRDCLDTFYRRREALLDEEPEWEVADAAQEEEGVQQDIESRDAWMTSATHSRMKMKDAEAGSRYQCKAEDEEPPRIKAEGVKKATTFHEGFKKEDENIIRVDGSSKRTSIFLADSDDEDEL